MRQIREQTAGTAPLSGSFSLAYSGHTFQPTLETGQISVDASAGALASELAALSTVGATHVSRSGPSAEGELAWTITFLAEEGDVPLMQPTMENLAGAGAVVRVSTIADGVAPVRGTLSLVASGIPGQVK